MKTSKQHKKTNPLHLIFAADLTVDPIKTGQRSDQVKCVRENKRALEISAKILHWNVDKLNPLLIEAAVNNELCLFNLSSTNWNACKIR